MRNNMITAKVSIVIPIYNVEQYLRRCLDSVQKQSYTNFEAIMIDDGSTDGSALIAEEYFKKDNRFVLIHQDNAGQGAARNTGIKHSTGEYLAFLDSDDWLDSKFLELMLTTAEKNIADIVICGVKRVFEDGSEKENPISNKSSYIVKDKESFLETASYSVCDKLYRSELFKNIQFPSHMKYEDYATTPRILAKADKIVCFSDRLYSYFWRANSTTNSVKVNRDILRAQSILENSELAEDNNHILAVYFVRNVMGTLIWGLLHSYNNIPEVESIIADGLEKYKDLDVLVNKTNIGNHKEWFGRQLLKGHYKMAATYAIAYDYLKNTLKLCAKFLGTGKKKL